MLLFADGIRQITFHKGITFSEITDFIDILRLAPRSEASDDDDIVTLLWEKNIRNMGYTAVEDAVDDDLVVEEGFLCEGSEQEISEESPSDSESYPAQTADSFPSCAGAEALTETELAALREELSGIDEKSLLSSAVDLFFDLLSHGQLPEAFPDIIHNIGRIMDNRIQRKDLQGAVEILKGLKKVSAIYHTLAQRELIDRVISRAGSLDNLKMLFTASLGSEIREYLLLLDKQSVPELIQMLGELEDRKKRRLLCEILAEISKEDIDTRQRPLMTKGGTS